MEGSISPVLVGGVDDDAGRCSAGGGGVSSAAVAFWSTPVAPAVGTRASEPYGTLTNRIDKVAQGGFLSYIMAL
jgi:hypothetical protein